MAQDLNGIAEQMIAKMSELEAKLQECQDYKDIAKLNKEKNDLEPVFECSKQLANTRKQLSELDELLKTEQDAEMRTMMNEEYTELEKKIPELEHQLKVLLIPKDPMDNRNAIVEIRAGTGGDEAGLFVQDLFAIYQLRLCICPRALLEASRKYFSMSSARMLTAI